MYRGLMVMIQGNVDKLKARIQVTSFKKGHKRVITHRLSRQDSVISLEKLQANFRPVNPKIPNIPIVTGEII